MNENQRAAFILAVIGFFPVAVAGPSVESHSPKHYMLMISFLVGMLAFGWLISIYHK